MVVRLLTGCWITVRIFGIAGSEVSNNFGFDHSLPKLRSSEPRRTQFGMQCGLLAAQNTHRAAPSNVFHRPLVGNDL
jgi:hypothetical protein